MTSTWLPEGYEAPKTSGNYMKLEDGANKFRVLSKPLIGWEYWNLENKPVRLKERPETLPEDIREDGKIKHFWAFVVWNYRSAKLQILEITQVSIQGAIEDLVLNEDWGSPETYDLTITKKGQKLDTEYSVQPSPHKTAPPEAMDALTHININLPALFKGEDPFADIDHDKTMSENNPFKGEEGKAYKAAF